MATIGLTLVTIVLTLLAVRTRSFGSLVKIAGMWTGYAVVTAMFAGVI